VCSIYSIQKHDYQNREFDARQSNGDLKDVIQNLALIESFQSETSTLEEKIIAQNPQKRLIFSRYLKFEERVLIISVPTNEMMVVKCGNASRHGLATGTGNTKSFNANDEDYGFWERVPRQRREYMKRMHLESGECLLCIIDKSMEGKL